MYINNFYFKLFFKIILFSFVSLLLVSQNNLLAIETTIMMQVILPLVIK